MRFDGDAFCLESDSEPTHAPARNRVIEEGLETILFHWGNELLPAPRLHMLARSGAITREQDLLAVDELGRIHIFELKKDKADAAAMFQPVSYLASRPQDDEQWVRRNIANTLWHGEQYAACRLAGLVSRQSVEKLRTDMSRKLVGKRVPTIDLLDTRIKKLSKLARERTGLDLKPETFRSVARSLVEQESGPGWDGPLEEPAKVLDAVAGEKLPLYWKVGRTKPHIIVWMIAPNVAEAANASRPLMERGLEIRTLSVDVREVMSGREWSIAVSGLESEVQRWCMADSFAALMSSIAGKHAAEYRSAAERMYLCLPSTTTIWQERGWAELGWRAAGGASVLFHVRGNRISRVLFTNNWTQGAALKIRKPLQRLYAQVRAAHPQCWEWSAQEPDAPCNREFVCGATRLVNDFWNGLETIGAFEVDPWGYWMPEET